MANDPSIRMRGMLGFAQKARKLIIGTDLVCRAMPLGAEKGKPNLVLISESASDATKKKVSVKSEFYGIPWRLLPLSTETLGALLGKTSTPATVAVCDPGFAKEIDAAITALTNSRKGVSGTPSETGDIYGSENN